MQSNHSEILTSFSLSGREIKSVDCVTVDSEMIANCGIKCNTFKHLHEKKVNYYLTSTVPSKKELKKI